MRERIIAIPNAQESPEAEPQRDMLTVDHAVNLFFMSFKYSQGYPYLQQSMIGYISSAHPDWKVGGEMKSEIKTRFLARATPYLANTKANNSTHVVHPNLAKEDSIEQETAKRLQDFQEAINGDAVPSIHEITRLIIQRDFRFLADSDSGIPTGRPRSNKDTAFLSHICHYAMNHASTGVSEFDQLFRAVYEHIGDGGLMSLDHEDDAKLTRVIEIYNQLHPYGRRKPAFTFQE